MFCRVAFSILVGVAACGPTDGRPGNPDAGTGPGDPADPGSNGEEELAQFTSGSRIKARTATTEITSVDGASFRRTVFAGWYDAQRAEACSPQLAADGKTRCLPAADSASLSFFADAACTMPVAAVAPRSCDGPALPAYIAVRPTPGCPQTVGPSLYRAGSTSSTYYSKSSDGTCAGPRTLDGYTFVSLGAAVPASEFVEMTLGTE